MTIGGRSHGTGIVWEKTCLLRESVGDRGKGLGPGGGADLARRHGIVSNFEQNQIMNLSAIVG